MAEVSAIADLSEWIRFGAELTTMAWQGILYLDDLIALPGTRGKGMGSALLRYLQVESEARGCEEVHLDTGYGRHDAHRS